MTYWLKIKTFIYSNNIEILCLNIEKSVSEDQ